MNDAYVSTFDDNSGLIIDLAVSEDDEEYMKFSIPLKTKEQCYIPKVIED